MTKKSVARKQGKILPTSPDGANFGNVKNRMKKVQKVSIVSPKQRKIQPTSPDGANFGNVKNRMEKVQEVKSLRYESNVPFNKPLTSIKKVKDVNNNESFTDNSDIKDILDLFDSSENIKFKQNNQNKKGISLRQYLNQQMKHEKSQALNVINTYENLSKTIIKKQNLKQEVFRRKPRLEQEIVHKSSEVKTITLNQQDKKVSLEINDRPVIEPKKLSKTTTPSNKRPQNKNQSDNEIIKPLTEELLFDMNLSDISISDDELNVSNDRNNSLIKKLEERNQLIKAEQRMNEMNNENNDFKSMKKKIDSNRQKELVSDKKKYKYFDLKKIYKGMAWWPSLFEK